METIIILFLIVILLSILADRLSEKTSTTLLSEKGEQTVSEDLISKRYTGKVFKKDDDENFQSLHFMESQQMRDRCDLSRALWDPSCPLYYAIHRRDLQEDYFPLQDHYDYSVDNYPVDSDDYHMTQLSSTSSYDFDESFDYSSSSDDTLSHSSEYYTDSTYDDWCSDSSSYWDDSWSSGSSSSSWDD